MTTKKQQTLDALMAMPADWIKASLAKPNAFMPQSVLTLHRVALRRKGVAL